MRLFTVNVRRGYPDVQDQKLNSHSKLNCITACVAKIDVGARGALVSFHNDEFIDPAGLIAYTERLNGAVKLRPDSKLVVNRAWGDPAARLNGLFQLTKGLSAIARKAR